MSSVADTVALEMEAAALRDAEASLRSRECSSPSFGNGRPSGSWPAGVAHDFRNMLVGVMAHATILIRDQRCRPSGWRTRSRS